MPRLVARDRREAAIEAAVRQTLLAHRLELKTLTGQSDGRFAGKTERRTRKSHLQSGSVIAISDERLEPVDKTTFTFIETEPGYPMPIKEWFYPGRNIGREFIYPKEQALEIARHAKEPILAAESVNLHDLSAIKVEAIGPIREAPLPTTATAENVTKSELPPVEEAKPTPAPEPEPAPPVAEEQPQPTEEAPAIAENTQPAPEPPAAAPAEPEQQPAPEAPSTTEQADNRELPRTAGELPLIALIGALCLGAGLGLKVLKAKS